MSNTYFQFKQFTVHQDKCAMKVCTDACLFGALMPPGPPGEEYSVLDIGTGTGLLSLMYAQKNPLAIIDAVEINTDAALQAKENFDASPWKDRLHIIKVDIKDLDDNKKYDLIISNPPFFEDDLRSVDKAKNDAKHDAALSLGELLKVIDAKLNTAGNFAILLPYHRVAYFEKEAAKFNFHPGPKILVQQTPAHDPFRGILFFSREKRELRSGEMAIKNEEGVYTDAFTDLLKDYYLNM